MKRGILAALFFLVALFVTVDCGTTGSKRFQFDAFAAGVDGASSPFTNDSGWTVKLDRAQITFGPVYLNVIPPLRTGSYRAPSLGLGRLAHADSSHLGEGRDVGEVLGQISFDALSPSLSKFQTSGTMTQEEIRTAEVWLWPAPGVAPEEVNIDTASVDVAGTATRNGDSVRFRGRLIFDDAWATDALPGERSATPITEQRMVRGIPAAFYPVDNGHLEIRFDVRSLFRGADFSNLVANPTDADGTKVLVQAKTGPVTTDQVMRNIFQGLRATTGTYDVQWVTPR